MALDAPVSQQPIHIAFYISGHGLGHLAQSAPVIEALTSLLPSIKITVCSTIAPEVMRSRIRSPVTFRWFQGDPGFVMRSPLDVDRGATAEAYRVFHSSWATRVDTERRWLESNAVDTVVVNVGYLPIAAAHASLKRNINRIALCSINWADIYLSFFGADAIYQTLLESYHGLDTFIQPTPSMPLSWLKQRVSVDPIATPGNDIREALNESFGLAESSTIGLITGGGHELNLDPARWPTQNVFWIIPGAAPLTSTWIGVQNITAAFTDLVHSVDVVVAKPGYGLFAEATCSGVALLYVDRSDWLEQPALLNWRRRYGRIEEVTRDQIVNGLLNQPVARVLRTPRFLPPNPGGAEQAAQLIVASRNS